MTATRNALQREVFQPEDERLLSIVNVYNPKKKRNAFLCLTISTEVPVVLKLSEIRKSEKSGSFRRKNVWLVRELRLVDGKNPRKPVPDFEFTFDKTFRYIAANLQEKESFLKQLYKLCNKYYSANKVEFINVQIPIDDIEYAYHHPQSANAVLNESSSQQGEIADEQDDYYQPISNREETDFRQLLAKCNLTLAEAEQFSKVLTSQLSMLDGANMEAILNSEKSVNMLVELIDVAIEEASALEAKLDAYDDILATVRDGVELMEEKDSLFHIQSGNLQRLYRDLENFLLAIDMPRDQQVILETGQLSDPASINRCTQAAQTLQKCMNTKLQPGMDKMKAFVDRKQQYQKLASGFAEKLVAQLTGLFQRLSEGDECPSGLKLPRHASIHQACMPYSDLLLWLKLMQPEGHKALLDRYGRYFQQLYRQEIGEFFAKLNREVGTLGGTGTPFDRKMSVKRSQTGDNLRMVKSTSGDSRVGIDMDLTEQQRFEKVLECLLAEVEPVLDAEQKFCVHFFHLNVEHLLAGSAETISTGSNDSGGSPEKKLDKLVGDEVRRIMSVLFNALDTHVADFITNVDRISPLNNMFLLARLYGHVMRSQDAGATYTAMVFGRMVVLAKQKMDAFVDSQVQSWREFYLKKREVVGVLPCVLNFERWASLAETAFKETQRRHDLDRWYYQLVGALTKAVDRVAEDSNNKSPPCVVLMENYHRIYSCLLQLKIASLETQKRESKQRYQDALEAYVKEFMGRPLDKLSAFFDLMEQRIQQGLKPEDVSYQMAFSKQELRKVIKEYPGKEVNKGLQELYAKVEKHLCEEENLLQVVWHRMQDEFIQQYKRYEGLIAQCYPNANIELEFSIQEILTYFSDIAQQH